jgi:predicted DsbA family dithiol-disulfide isomerase
VRLREMFAASGYDYNPHPEIVPNTRLALEIGEAARSEDRHPAFHDAVMDAYWRDARDIGDVAELRAIAGEVGLTPAVVEAAIAERAFADAVDGSSTWAQQAGINAVPAFVFDSRVLVLGAQPHEVLAQAAEQAREPL